MQVLHSIQAIDLSCGIAGPIVGMFLSDFGAEVIKVETPKGDPARQDPGFPVWNRGKQGVVVDPGSPERCRWLGELIAGADVCIVNDTAALAGFGLDLEQLRRENPRLVVVAVPPYSDQTPWAGGQESHGLLGAASGLAWRQSSTDGGPVEWVLPQCLSVQGVWATACTVSALLERERSGRGQVVTVTGMNAVMIAAVGQYTITTATPDPDTAVGPAGRHPLYTRVRAGDGKWLGCGALGAKFETAALEILGLADLLHDERLGGSVQGLLAPDNLAWVTARINEAFLTRNRDEWLQLLAAAGIPCGPLEDASQWLDHPQVDAIGMRVQVEDPERGLVTMPGVPLTLTRTPGRVAGPAPALGADDDKVTLRPVSAAAPPEPARLAAGPLSGYRIIDMGTFVASPYAGHLLAELGADVIKVEPPTGDPFRATGYTYNRGMRSLALDLRSTEGQAVYGQLVASCDAVLDALRPGVSRKLNLDHASLATFKPDIVALSLSGYGEQGPLADRPGVDTVIQAMSGIMSRQGGDSDPVVNTLAIVDTTTAAMGVLGVVLGLFHRERTGEGQRGWFSLVGTATYLQSGELVRFDDRPAPAVGASDYRGSHWLDCFYRTSDGWVRVQATDPDAVDAPALAAAGVELDEGTFSADPRTALGQALASVSGSTAVAMLANAGVSAVRVRKISEVVRDEDLLATEFVHVRPADEGADILTPGRYATFSRTQRRGPLPVPGAGEHSRALLAEAGLSDREIADHLRSGVVIEGERMAQKLAPLYR